MQAREAPCEPRVAPCAGTAGVPRPGGRGEEPGRREDAGAHQAYGEARREGMHGEDPYM